MTYGRMCLAKNISTAAMIFVLGWAPSCAVWEETENGRKPPWKDMTTGVSGGGRLPRDQDAPRGIEQAARALPSGGRGALRYHSTEVVDVLVPAAP